MYIKNLFILQKQSITMGNLFENFMFYLFLLIPIYILIISKDILGSLLVLIGTIVIITGRINLKSNFSALPKANELITAGIYSKIRHPMYAGLIILSIGTVLIFESLFIRIIAFILILSSVIRAYLEEKVLIKKFGKKYLDYRKRTWL